MQLFGPFADSFHPSSFPFTLSRRLGRGIVLRVRDRHPGIYFLQPVLNHRAEFSDLFRHPFGQISGFAEIVLQIIQLETPCVPLPARKGALEEMCIPISGSPVTPPLSDIKITAV